jgi:cell division protein FtsN
LRNASLNSTPEIEHSKKQTSALSVPVKTKKTPKHRNNKPTKPKYEFYTILPETEIVIPDHEINTRSREERVGKRKPGYYVIQAGSFRDFTEADKLRANLALMGIESRVEKATVEAVVWNRVKIGPYSHSSKVSVMKNRLKKQGIDTIVIEEKG